MTTLVGIFFSLISILGLYKGQSKGSSKSGIRKLVLLAFSIFLIIGQVLYMYSALDIGGQEFIGFSGLISGIILILAYQKHEAW